MFSIGCLAHGGSLSTLLTVGRSQLQDFWWGVCKVTSSIVRTGMDFSTYIHPQIISNCQTSIDGADFIAAMLPPLLLLFFVDMGKNEIVLHLFVSHWLPGVRWVPPHSTNREWKPNMTPRSGFKQPNKFYPLTADGYPHLYSLPNIVHSSDLD